MMSKKMLRATSALALVFAATTTTSFAGALDVVEPAAVVLAAPANSFGYIGLSGVYGAAENPEDSDAYSTIAPMLEVAHGFVLSNGSTVVVDGMLRFDNYDPDMLDNEVPLTNFQASAHYLHPVSGDLTIGGFAGYGYAPFEDANEKYQVGFLGGTVHYDTSNDLSVFGQIGYGTSFDADAMSGAGFYNGGFARAGIIYSGFDFANIRVEAEIAATEEYEDSSEPGSMWTLGIFGESNISSVQNLSVSYGVRYGSYDALNDPDFVNEVSASFGIKYTFGGGNSERFNSVGYVGSPYLPLRASFWTPTMD